MSHIYDNWERLVAAVLKRELFRQLSRCSSFSSDISSTVSERISYSDLSYNNLMPHIPLDGYFQLCDPIWLYNFVYNRPYPLPKPPSAAYKSPNGKLASGAAFRFAFPANGLAWYRKKRQDSFFVLGVPKLRMSELESACEDFSNVLICYSPDCALFKGTLSNGVELAIAFMTLAYERHWSNWHEAQFRKKIVALSKVNHKNFVKLLGYCAEEKPFTRMMVFEYAPNGTLFERLHIKEAERLDWATRLRIAMGIAYCLEYMHHLTPPLAHRNLSSIAVYLMEDNSAKLSDYDFLAEGVSAETERNLQNDVCGFGLILLEMITGKLPHSMIRDCWLQNYLGGEIPKLSEAVDPTLERYEEDQLEQIGGVIKSCVNPDPWGRPSMNHICTCLSEITAVGPDGAIPKYSQLLEAEVENLVVDAR